MAIISKIALIADNLSHNKKIFTVTSLTTNTNDFDYFPNKLQTISQFKNCLSLTCPSWLNPIGLCCSLSRHHTSDHTASISPELSVSRGDTTTRPQTKTIKSNQ